MAPFKCRGAVLFSSKITIYILSECEVEKRLSCFKSRDKEHDFKPQEKSTQNWMQGYISAVLLYILTKLGIYHNKHHLR